MSRAGVLKKLRYKQEAVGVQCALCGKMISKSGDKGLGGLTLDHIIPKSLGGTYAKDNLQPAHQICNRKRQAMLVKEFIDKSSQEAILRQAISILDGYQRVKVKVIRSKKV